LFRITKQLETENAVCGFSFLAYNSYFKPLVISILIDFEMLKIGILFLQYITCTQITGKIPAEPI